jgi:dienelactone hydrolase
MRWALVLVLLATGLAAGWTPPPETTTVFTDPQTKRRMLEAYFQRLSAPKKPQYSTAESWSKRKQELRQLVLQDLGLDPLPERVPLTAQVVATKEYADYRLERIWFQTLPKVWASGWLYLPKGAAGQKYPGILNPHGHWNEGARHPVVQARCIALAKKGYVAFAVDSVHVTHWPLGVCSVGMMTWNNMRALDYLETRPEVDATRLGCTGESGGGQQTMYLMALEDRLQAAVPAVLISYFQRILFATEDAHCFCNHVPFLLRHTDEPELTALFAPKPALYISVTGDWTAAFPQEEYPPIAAVYAAMGVPERVASRHFTSGHDYSKPMREAMYAWFNKWLKGIDDPQAAKEPEIKTETPQALRAMDKPPPGNRGEAGILEYFSEQRKFAKPLPPTPATWPEYQRRLQTRLLTLLGEDAVVDGPLQASTVERTTWRRHSLEKITYTSEQGITIPAIVVRSAKTPAKAPPVIVLTSGGKAELLLQQSEFVEDLLAQGFLLFAPDVRFCGELRHRWDLNTVIWGRPEAGMAAHDVKRGVDYLRQRTDVVGDKIVCVGLGKMGVTAVLSGVCDHRIAVVAVDECGPIYGQGREHPLLPHLLRYADLPQVTALLAPRPLWLNQAQPAEEFSFVREAYRSAGGKVYTLPQMNPASARAGLPRWLQEVTSKDK